MFQLLCNQYNISEELLANLEETELLVGDTIVEVREDIPQVRERLKITDKWLLLGCGISYVFLLLNIVACTCTTANREIFAGKIGS